MTSYNKTHLNRITFKALLLLLLCCMSACSISIKSKTNQSNQTTKEPSSVSYTPTETKVAASPKAPWGEFEIVKEQEQTTLSRTLLWLPNRLLDFIDIFRIDAGVGVSTGVVIRASSYMQAGLRLQAPGMLRVGVFGRKSPVLFEAENEIGIGPIFKQSEQRNLCKGIAAVGLDLIIIGLHLGICPEELADFTLGIFTIDLMKDDL